MDSLFGSTYATPSRPISMEQFHSLREKMVKESPKLYKNQMLSDPAKRSEMASKSQSVPVTPKNSSIFGSRQPAPVGLNGNENYRGTFNSSSVGKGEDMQILESENDRLDRPGDSMVDPNIIELGSFESPILRKLASRTVNKEMETQTIVVNLVILAIWNLFAKFLKIFILHARYGKELAAFFHRTFWGWQTALSVLKWYHKHPRIADWVNWSNFDLLLHSIVTYNVIISLWRLFSKVKVDDLNLTKSQRELLGLSSNDDKKAAAAAYQTSSSTIEKPHVILNNQKGSLSQASSNSQTVPSTPFLFKSLETPLKAKAMEQQQQQQQQQINLQRQAQSAFVSKVNAFGSLRSNMMMNKNGKHSINNNNTNTNTNKNTFTPTATTSAPLPTPVGRTGYIPSNKYAYMMNSPSPRKRM